MLRPHHREYAKFDHVGHASHGKQDARIFFFIETMAGDGLGRDFRHETALARRRFLCHIK